MDRGDKSVLAAAEAEMDDQLSDFQRLHAKAQCEIGDCCLRVDHPGHGPEGLP